MTYNLKNVKEAPSYEKLKRNGFSDLDVVAFYGAPKHERPIMFKQISSGVSSQARQGTQKCTQKEVHAEFEKYMNTTFTVLGKSFNPVRMGYKFGWNNNKSRFGVHKMRWRTSFLGDIEYTSKRIELSIYMLEHAEKSLSDWIDTILHEIAHAIDYSIRGESNHDAHWVRIAKEIGCSGERCGTYKIVAKKKYEANCSCGNNYSRHRLTYSSRYGSCGTCRTPLKWVQNY